MTYGVEALLAVVILFNFQILGTSRLRAVIHAAAVQGVILGLLPLLVHHDVSLRLLVVCGVAVAMKGFVIPGLLRRAMRDATIHREVEPLIGFTASIVLGALGTGLASYFATSLPLVDGAASRFVVPTAFSTVFTGFLVLTTRRKAINQVVGYLTLENGVFVFGLLVLEAMPLLVEFGVLLDLFVGVFVMGIILKHIQRTFSTFDSAQLSALEE